MYWYELLFLWTQCYVILTVLNVCTSIGWIIFSHSYLHVTHDKISVCLAIWLIWWTNISVIKMINTPGHVLSPGWPLCKRSGLTLIEVSQHAYSSYQASSLPFIFYHVILATWCNWLDFYWCWIKFCLSLSLSLASKAPTYWLFVQWFGQANSKKTSKIRIKPSQGVHRSVMQLFHAMMSLLGRNGLQWPFLLTWINFNPSMDK